MGIYRNILPTIAIDDVLQRNGKSPEEAFELISSHMWAALNPEGFRKLSKLPFFLPVMRKIIPLGFKYGSGKGWKYVWHPEDPKEYYHFETLECLYKYEFSKHGVLERFGPMFCRSDIINYGTLSQEPLNCRYDVNGLAIDFDIPGRGEGNQRQIVAM